MSLDEAPLVGDSDARAIHGRSAGGALVVLGRGRSSVWPDRLAPYRLTSRGDVVESLTDAAAVAAHGHGPLVLVADDAELSPVALLDLLDAPADVTAALVLDAASTRSRPEDAAMVRVAAHDRQVASVGTPAHVVTDPTGYAAGALRVRAPDRARVADALGAAAATPASTDERVQPFDLALLAVVRSGVPVMAVTLGPYTFRRGALHSPGAAGSAWQQRLRGASRGNDGAFSTAVIRPISRRLTAVGLRRGWAPNLVTLVSLLLGLLACAATATGSRWAWVAAAFLLQLSLVVDCVDGEIARFTRKPTALGGWLDAVGDRVKEFAMVAAVAFVSARQGPDLWWLAMLVLGLLAVRHIEDFAYTSRARALPGPTRADVVDLFAGHDGGPSGARTQLPPPPDLRARVVRVVKQVLHLPIAERYLLMSIALVVNSPTVFLVSLGVASAIAFGWTETGRLAKALLRRDAFTATRPDPDLGGLVDLAVLPRPTGRGRFAWQVPALLVAAEVGALLWATRGGDASARAAAYLWLSAVCWHHYDTVYRVREAGQAPVRWLTRVTLGTDGRVVLLVLVGLFVPHPTWLLGAGGLLLFVAYAAESLLGWRRVLGRGARGPAGGSGEDQTGSTGQDVTP